MNFARIPKCRIIGIFGHRKRKSIQSLFFPSKEFVEYMHSRRCPFQNHHFQNSFGTGLGYRSCLGFQPSTRKLETTQVLISCEQQQLYRSSIPERLPRNDNELLLFRRRHRHRRPVAGDLSDRTIYHWPPMQLTVLCTFGAMARARGDD